MAHYPNHNPLNGAENSLEDGYIRYKYLHKLLNYEEQLGQDLTTNKNINESPNQVLRNVLNINVLNINFANFTFMESIRLN